MNIRFSPKVCIATTALIAASGGSMLMTGCKTAALVALAAGGAVATAVVIAKYKANDQQKEAAERQVRALYPLAAKPAPTLPPTAKTEPKSKKHGTPPAAAAAPAETGVTPPPPVQPEAPGTPARPIPSTDELANSGGKAMPNFLAVPVPPQNIPEEKGRTATYMLWDTHRQQLATDDVYVLKREVRGGATVKLEHVKAKVAANP